MVQSVTRQWPALPESNPESLALWARQITRLLQEGAIVNSSQIADFGLGNVTASGALTDNAIVAGAGTTGVKVYTGSEVPPGSDLNGVVETSIVSADGAVANKPNGNTGNWMVLTLMRVANIVTQLAFSRAAGTAGRVFNRINNAGTWEAWVRMLAEPDAASVADVRSAAAATALDAQVLTAPLLESAAAGVALTDAATVAVNWDNAINFTLTVTANRVIGNPTNGQPGTWRTILVQGNDATDRVITFDTQFLGEIPVITDADSGRKYLLMIYCVSTTHFVVSAKRAQG